jgi:hypothetical protein
MLQHRQMWLDKKANQFLFFTKCKFNLSYFNAGSAFLKNLRTLNKQCEPVVQLQVPSVPQQVTPHQQRSLVRSRPQQTVQSVDVDDERNNKRSKK